MDKANLVKVVKIKIRVGNKELELTTEELRGLREVINEVIGPQPLDPIYAPVWASPPPPLDRYPASAIYCDPNSEHWPCGWALEYGPLKQSATLVVKA